MVGWLCYFRLSVKEREVFFWPCPQVFSLAQSSEPLASARSTKCGTDDPAQYFRSSILIRAVFGCTCEEPLSSLTSQTWAKNKQPSKRNPFSFQPLYVSQPLYDKWVILTALRSQKSKWRRSSRLVTVNRFLAFNSSCGANSFALCQSNRAASWSARIPFSNLLTSYSKVRNKAPVIHEKQFQASR